MNIKICALFPINEVKEQKKDIQVVMLILAHNIHMFSFLSIKAYLFSTKLKPVFYAF